MSLAARVRSLAVRPPADVHEAGADPRASASAREGGRGVSGIVLALVFAYLAFLLAAMVLLGVTPSMDLFFVGAGFLAIGLGRGRAFIRDWAPFALIFFAWEGMRGIANAFGQGVHVGDFIDMEVALFGTVPTVDLQQALYVPGSISPLDVLMSSTYISHFFFPLAFAFFLWIRDRSRFYDFAVALMVMSYLAFVTFVIIPVAPPRFASAFGFPLQVYDIAHEVALNLDWTGFSWVYRNLVGNPVAAFPSMHAAYPVLVLLFIAERSKLAAVAWLPVVATIWFATVYLGHHYVVDLIGGLLYAIAVYAFIRSSLYRRLLARLGRSRRGPVPDAPFQG